MSATKKDENLVTNQNAAQGASKTANGIKTGTTTTTSPTLVSNVQAASAPVRTSSYTVNTNNGQYINQLNSLYDRVMNQKPFQYDINSDVLYKQLADQYTTLGQRAMKDTMGQASALTGGYGNSYATSVGNQAYNQYLTGLTDQIPALYQQAYNRHQGDLQNLLAQYELAAQHPSIVDSLSPRTVTVSEPVVTNGVSLPVSTVNAVAQGLTLDELYYMINGQKK